MAERQRRQPAHVQRQNGLLVSPPPCQGWLCANACTTVELPGDDQVRHERSQSAWAGTAAWRDGGAVARHDTNEGG